MIASELIKINKCECKIKCALTRGRCHFLFENYLSQIERSYWNSENLYSVKEIQTQKKEKSVPQKCFFSKVIDKLTSPESLLVHNKQFSYLYITNIRHQLEPPYIVINEIFSNK